MDDVGRRLGKWLRSAAGKAEKIDYKLSKSTKKRFKGLWKDMKGAGEEVKEAGMVLKKIMAFLAGSKANAWMDDITDSVDKTIAKAEYRIERATRRVIKSSIIFVLMLMGFIFLLVGLSSYIQETWTLEKGVGLLIVGGALLLLGIIANLLRD